MSFGYDGSKTVYFLYLLGDESRKRELSDRTETARFLVYSAEATFNWRSVLLTGRLSDVPDSEGATAEEALSGAWRPDVLERALASEATALYRFEIDDRTGIKHLGLPEGFDERTDGSE
jgi:nitroimidazol reductase NimA-like FMN-containing flavoprotein (pyridoxamine 5'-phosphate oxidase superfamily)